MKTFLLKIIIILIPVIILLSITEFISRKNDTSKTYFQKKYLIENQTNIDGVIFGSSHMWRSLFPKYLDYNVASFARSGSAINIDSYLYNYVSKLVTPKFYVFDLSQTYLNSSKDQNYTSTNKLQYYFPTSDNRNLSDNFLIKLPLRKYFFFEKEEKIKYDKWGSEITIPKKINFLKKLGFNDSLLLNITRSKRVLKKHNESINKSICDKNITFLKKIIDDCKKKNIKLIFMSPPKYHIYNKKLNHELALQRDVFLKEFVDNKNVFFLNFENFEEDNSKLFFDLNHLNIEGAKIFSEAFNKRLKTIL